MHANVLTAVRKMTEIHKSIRYIQICTYNLGSSEGSFDQNLYFMSMDP